MHHQRDQLDENVPVTNLEKTVSYFETIYPLQLSQQRTDCPVFLADVAQVLAAGCDNVNIEVKRVRVLMDSRAESAEVGCHLTD